MCQGDETTGKQQVIFTVENHITLRGLNLRVALWELLTIKAVKHRFNADAILKYITLVLHLE